MSRHAVCNKDGLVVNVIVWEGAEFLPPRDHYVIHSATVDIGDVYNIETNTFTKPDRTSKDPEPEV